MKNWELWRKNEEGFWGTWDCVDTVDLPDGPYWVIPDAITAECAGEIDGCAVCANSAEHFKPQIPYHAEESVFWYLVLNGEAFPLGRWALAPGFLEDYIEPQPVDVPDDDFFEMDLSQEKA